MKNYFFIGCIFFIFSAYALDLKVLSNNWSKNDKITLGNTEPYPQTMVNWYKENFPKLPYDYQEKNGFIFYEPLVHYIDSVNWSLFPLRQFHEVGKGRWIRIPAGTKIKRNASDGSWKWPIGTESAKLLKTKVKNSKGKMVWRDLELRLVRKISETSNERNNWAMATYVRGQGAKDDWVIAPPPHLKLDVKNALVSKGKTRNVIYNLTSTEACMTCHSHAQNSTVDYKRGNGFIYGINDELLSGVTTIRLSQWNSSPEMQHEATLIDSSTQDDWAKIKINNLDPIKKMREILAPLIEGEMPELKF